MRKLKKEFVYNYNGKNWVILDDFMALKEKLKKTQKEYAKTRQQLNEANRLILWCARISWTGNQEEDDFDRYLAKWGVK